MARPGSGIWCSNTTGRRPSRIRAGRFSAIFVCLRCFWSAGSAANCSEPVSAGIRFRGDMGIVPLLGDEEAGEAARAVFDDIRTTRNTDFINKFWRALANDPATLKRTWESLKEVMAPGALDPKTKELIY